MSTELRAILSPPSQPVCTGSYFAWNEICRALGTRLPIDYRQFVNTYGSGSIDNFLNVLTPFAESSHLNLVTAGTKWLDAFRELRSKGHETIPYPLYPEQGGLLPWAYTDNGDLLFWMTNGTPSDWVVCINETRSPDWEVFKVNMTGFLKKTLTRRVRPRFVPDDVFLLDHYVYVARS